METDDLILLIVLIILILSNFFTILIIIGFDFGFGCEELKNQGGISNESFLEKVERIAKANSLSREYELDVYDCTNFSIQLIERLKEEDINASCVFGNSYEIIVDENKNYTLKKPSNHTWVAINYNNITYYVESVYGYILSNETFREHYKILKEGECL